MSRSGYTDDCDGWALICWRGAVASAIRGHRGQAMLKELLQALDAMPDKKLIAGELESNGEYCTLGVLGKNRGLNLNEIDPYETDYLSRQLGVAEALVKEIVYENDEGAYRLETPEQRWSRMRQWVVDQIRAENAKGVPEP